MGLCGDLGILVCVWGGTILCGDPGILLTMADVCRDFSNKHCLVRHLPAIDWLGLHQIFANCYELNDGSLMWHDILDHAEKFVFTELKDLL